ncbi:hypothetical protein [Streptomyces sp. RerS4]|uniref:hypothetical protein n=1 Tax=Streptomyces sp. RerS4 TaxID=2942449 RepID=UPI00201BFE4A|nr:hypothetical protein [Streptomyces sp. RerS4]UQW99132.1 hypothetical protein M4D82_00185 [Streptomyces sp. RerS4]
MKTPTSHTDSVRALRLVAVAPRCHLCPDEDSVLADPAVMVDFLPASGILRQVGLCASCDSGRPSRGRPELGPADGAWRVVERCATELLAAYEAGRWIPHAQELEFTAGLARVAWSEASVRSAVRDAGRTALAGRLVRDVLLGGRVYLVLANVSADDPALHSLRRLVDVLATAAECPAGPPNDAA